MAPSAMPSTPCPPTDGFRQDKCNRAFQAWDVGSGRLVWGGNTEPLWREHRLPDTFADWLAAVHPDDAAAVERVYRQVADGGPAVRLEYRVRRPDGKVRPVVAHVSRLTAGAVIGCLTRNDKPAAVRVWEPPPDPAPANQADSTVPAYDPMYERFFDLSEDLLCVADLKTGHFVRLNPSFERVLGHPARVLREQPFLVFVHPDDRRQTREVMAQLERGEAVVQFANRYRTAAGDYRWLEWAARAVPVEKVVFAVARDVTRRVEMQERLRRQEERERAVLDHAGVLVHVKDGAGRYEYVNRHWERVTGVVRELAVGRTDAQVFPDRPAGETDHDGRVVRTGEPFEGEETVPTADGPRTFAAVKVPLRDADGRVAAVAGVATDITDRLRAEAAEGELRTAQLLHRKLYPAAAPVIPGVDVAGRARPASMLCGDYFDYIPRPGGRWGLAVGDVCGHGLGPAITMVETRATLRLLLAGDGGIAAAARVLNRELSRVPGGGPFITLLLADLDPAGRTVRWVGGGHDGHLLRASGQTVHLDSTGMPLGILDPIDLAEPPPLALSTGDVLALFTDGLTEAADRHGDQFGTDRLLAVVRRHAARPAAEILDRVFEQVDRHLDGRPQEDDMTIVVVKVGERPA